MSEMTLKQAAAETKKFGRMLKGMEQLVQVAEALESADQAVADRRRQEEDVLAKIASAQTELQRLEASIQGTKESAQEILAEASTKAVAIGSKAKSDAEGVLATAGAEVEVFKGQVLALRGDLDELAQQKRHAAAELDALNTKIAEARATTKRIVEA